MDDIMLIHGDCLQAMPTLPAESIDLVLTDPPYGTTRNWWDSVIPLDEMWDNLHRVTTMHAAVILFTSEPFTSRVVESNEKEFRYDLIWEKPNGSDFLNVNRKPLKAHENIGVFYRKMPPYTRHPLRVGTPYKASGSSKKLSSNWGKFTPMESVNTTGERCPTTVLQFKHERGYHPTQKPVPLLEWLIKSYSRPGDTVLDFTMGSGSTGVACVNTGRRFIGIEKDDAYFETARERIAKAQEEANLG